MTHPGPHPLSDADFVLVSNHLSRAAGLVFDKSRRPVLAAILTERLRAARVPDIPTYVDLLARPGGEAEEQRLLDAVTVQETQFFRNPPQMEALRGRILPELLRRAAGRDRPLTIWSAGCSTGEEPYTLAMLLLELAPALASTGGARVVGTDVSAEALRVARRGVYSGRSLAAVPTSGRVRWFEPWSRDGLAVRPEVRDLVDLRLHNVVTERPPFGPGEVDLVVCRNVTIYFSRETTRLLIGAFHDVLAEGGYLLIGHSETLWQVSDAFSLVTVDDAFVYRRTYDARGSLRSPRRGPSGARRRAVPRVGSGARADARPPDGRALLAQASTALSSGDYLAAVRLAELAVATEPLLASAYVVLGQAHCSLGQEGSAVGPLRKAVYLDPAAGHAHFLLAGALARVGQTTSAAVSYRAAAAALPGCEPMLLEAFLGGREVAELVDLCTRLADMCERRPEQAAGQVSLGGGAR